MGPEIANFHYLYFYLWESEFAALPKNSGLNPLSF